MDQSAAFLTLYNQYLYISVKDGWVSLYCELTTGKEWQSSISSWDKTFFLTSPWNWISPQKLGNNSQHSQHGWFVLSQYCILCVYLLNKWRLTQLYRHVAWKYLWTSWTLYKGPKDPHRTDGLENKDRKTLALTDIIYIFFKQSYCNTYFSCVVKISKQLLASIWLSILRKGIDTLKENVHIKGSSLWLVKNLLLKLLATIAIPTIKCV